jgi:hypothetical protein
LRPTRLRSHQDNPSQSPHLVAATEVTATEITAIEAPTAEIVIIQIANSASEKGIEWIAKLDAQALQRHQMTGGTLESNISMVKPALMVDHLQITTEGILLRVVGETNEVRLDARNMNTERGREINIPTTITVEAESGRGLAALVEVL